MRFLRKLGFDAVGVDIADEMVRRAQAIDPAGDYRRVADGDLSQFEDDISDLVLSAFTFDNIPTASKKVETFSELARVLKPEGRIVSLVSSPEIYWNEWASFTTKDFPENKHANCGDVVRIIVTALEDKRPVEDILWSDEDYRAVFEQAGLTVVEACKPLWQNRRALQLGQRDDDPALGDLRSDQGLIVLANSDRGRRHSLRPRGLAPAYDSLGLTSDSQLPIAQGPPRGRWALRPPIHCGVAINTPSVSSSTPGQSGVRFDNDSATRGRGPERADSQFLDDFPAVIPRWHGKCTGPSCLCV